jgi:hypothetical protein
VEASLWSEIFLLHLDNDNIELVGGVIMLKEYDGMPIMRYLEREDLKKSAKSQLEKDWAHYHRFLEGLIPVRGKFVFRAEFHPTFATYCVWLRKYPGWTDTKVTPRQPYWVPGSKLSDYPMNRFYAGGFQKKIAKRSATRVRISANSARK